MKNETIPLESLNEAKQVDEYIRYWYALLNHRWLVLTITLVALTFSSIRYYKMPDFYVASARILVHKLNETQVVSYNEAAAPQSWDPSYYETQVEIIRGLPVCRKVAKSVNLAEHYHSASNEIAAQILRAKMVSRLIRNTRILVVTVTDSDPDWSARLANEIATAYIDEARQDRMFVSDQILEWFPDANMVRNSSPDELLQKIADDEIVQKLPTVANNPTVKRLKDEKIDIEARIQELLGRYTPEHPQVRELTGRLEYIKNEIKAQTEKITAALRASLEGELNVSNIKILEKATVPSRPAGPNRKKGVITFTLVGIAIGIGIAIALDSLDKTIRSDEDILGIPGVPFLGSVPLCVLKKKVASAHELLEDHAVSDAANTLNTALLFSMPKGQNKLIMLTSSIPEEGKTTISYLIAATMAKMGGKILLVELDLRKPSLHEKLNVPAHKYKGMSDYLVGQATFEEIVVKMEKPANLDVIFAGGSSPNPITLITSSAFDEFLATAQQFYDRILFDTPPSFQIPDPIVLSNKMHGIVYVIGAGMVHKKVALKTIRKYNFVGSTIFGSVLNRVNYKKHGYVSYQRYYGKYYGGRRKAA